MVNMEPLDIKFEFVIWRGLCGDLGTLLGGACCSSRKMAYFSGASEPGVFVQLPGCNPGIKQTPLIIILVKIFIIFSCLPELTLAEIYKIPLKHSSSFGSELDAAVREMGGMPHLSENNNLHGKPGQGYYLEMSIGRPSQQLNVLVDTGSSNFAVAAAPAPEINKYFNTDKSLTFTLVGTDVYVPYTKGNWRGHLGQDLVAITSLPNTSIRANIACITSSDQFYINGSNWQGILGLAYQDIARPDSSIEPFFDSLVAQSNISDMFSLQLCGTIDTDASRAVSMGGTLVVGGMAPDLYMGPMLYATIYKDWYYEVIVTAIRVEQQDVDLDCKEFNLDKAIVDSGTTNLRLPKKVFQKVKALIQQNTYLLDGDLPAGFWLGEDIHCWPEEDIPYEQFPSLTMSLAESRNSTISLVISPQQYLRAVAEDYSSYEDEPVSRDKDCFKFAIAPSDTGTVIGAVVMEGFYVNFDRATRRVGFAKTTCPKRSSTTASRVDGPYRSEFDTYHCAYVKPEDTRPMLMTVAYVMAGICGACLLPLVAMVVQWQYQRCRGNQEDILPDLSHLLKHEGP